MADENEDEVAVFTPELANKILAAFRKLEASGLLGSGRIEDINKRNHNEREPQTYFVNTSDEEVPPYACMQIVGMVDVGDISFCEIDKPADASGEAGAFIFNGHGTIPVDGEGVAQQGRYVRAIKEAESTATAGDHWQPVADDWTIEQDDAGPFIMCGDDVIDTDIVRVVIDSAAGGEASIEYQIISIDVMESGPYTGLTVASVTVMGASCGRSDLIGDTVEVVDHSGCIFDLVEASLVDVWGWASWRVFESLDPEAEAGELTPCHWSADDRCCVDGEGA